MNQKIEIQRTRSQTPISPLGEQIMSLHLLFCYIFLLSFGMVHKTYDLTRFEGRFLQYQTSEHCSGPGYPRGKSQSHMDSLAGLVEQLPYGGVVVRGGQPQHLHAQLWLPSAEVKPSAQVLQQLLARGSNHGPWGSFSLCCSADPPLMRPHFDSEIIQGVNLDSLVVCYNGW